MVKIVVNDYQFVCNQKITLLNLCRLCGLNDYKFCYHENLPIAGNCRICLIEVEEMDKQVAACVSNVEPNSSIWTENVFCKKARENVIEILLINHPLDCPICDQGGDCDLQDQVRVVGGFKSRFFFNKRTIKDKNCGLFIKTIMTRCIHCLRCVRFNKLVGERAFGIINRSNKSEIVYHSFDSSYFDFRGVSIDLCPVGALTSRSYSFKCRPWELKLIESIDLSDSLGANLYINYKESEIFRITPKANFYVNGNIISDKIRFSLDSANVNRIKVIYKQDVSAERYERSSWSNYLLIIKKLLLSNNLTFLINENLDVESIFYLKKITYKYCNKISLFKTSISHNINFYKKSFNNFLFNVEIFNDCCFFFGVQPKIECSILNLKLRLKYKKSLVSIFGFGRFFVNNIEICFLVLNIKKIIHLLESKLKSFSVQFHNFVDILLFFSKSFYKNIFGIYSWSYFIKTKLLSLKIVEINNYANSESLVISNIDSVLKKKYNSLLFCISLEDNLKTNHIISTIQFNAHWYTTHKPKHSFLYKYVVPIASFLESKSYYINIEKRIQKTQQILNYLPSVYNLLKSIFNAFIVKIYFEYYYLNYLFELITKFNQNLVMFFLFENFQFEQFFYCNKTVIRMSLLKSTLENIFCSNIWTKNSNLLTQAYIVQKKKAYSFFVMHT